MYGIKQIIDFPSCGSPKKITGYSVSGSRSEFANVFHVVATNVSKICQVPPHLVTIRSAGSILHITVIHPSKPVCHKIQKFVDYRVNKLVGT